MCVFYLLLVINDYYTIGHYFVVCSTKPTEQTGVEPKSQLNLDVKPKLEKRSEIELIMSPRTLNRAFALGVRFNR